MIYSLPFKVNKTMTIETTNNLAHLNTQSLAILSSFSNTFELNEKESKLVQRIKKTFACTIKTTLREPMLIWNFISVTRK